MPSDDSPSEPAVRAMPRWLTQKVEWRSFLTWKAARRLLVAAAVAFVAIQLVPVERVNPPVETEAPARADIRAVLRRSCGDCHSNETVWPWYSRVAPVSWLVARDVREGRSHMNLSTWNRYDADEQQRKRTRSAKLVQRGEMPPWFYLPMHRDAVTSDHDVVLIQEWATDPGASSAR